MKGESESEEPAFVLYKECVLFQNEMDKTLMSLCPRSATASFSKKINDVEHEGENREPVTINEWFGAVAFQSILSMVDARLCSGKQTRRSDCLVSNK